MRLESSRHTGARGRSTRRVPPREIGHVDSKGVDVFVGTAFVENGRSGTASPTASAVRIEPGGNRVEMFHGGYLKLLPDSGLGTDWSDVDAEEGDTDHLGFSASRRGPGRARHSGRPDIHR